MLWLIIAAIVLLILCLVSPFFGLIAYMGILYLRPMEVYPQLAPYHIARIFAVAVIISFIVKNVGTKKIFFNSRQDKLLLGLLAAIVLSFFTGWIPQCMVVFEQMIKNIIVYALIVGLITSERRLKILLWTLLIMSAMLGYNTFQEYMSLKNSVQYYVRIGGFSGGYFGGAGDLAVMLNIMIPVGFFLGMAARPAILRPIALALAVACIAGMLSTLARGAGLITFGVVVIGLAFFGFQARGIIKKSLSILLIAASLAGVVLLAPSAIKERASTIADYQHQGTATRRIEYWKLGVKMFLSSPLIGVGAGNYPLRYKEFGGWEQQWRVSHNMYIEVLSELGIIGFAFFSFLLFFTFKDGFNINRLLKIKGKSSSFLYGANQGVMISLLAYCAGGMFQSIFRYPILYIIIAIMVAIKKLSVDSVDVKVKI